MKRHQVLAWIALLSSLVGLVDILFYGSRFGHFWVGNGVILAVMAAATRRDLEKRGD